MRRPSLDFNHPEFTGYGNIDLHCIEHISFRGRQLSDLVDRLIETSEQPDDDEPDFTSPELFTPSADSDDEPAAETPAEPTLDPETRQRIEALFDQVARDRGKAVRLKRELDRLGVFDQYEDRFLDLFRKGG